MTSTPRSPTSPGSRAPNSRRRPRPCRWSRRANWWPSTSNTTGRRRRVEPSYVVIADGSMNRFGRELGSVRRKDYPMGLAARGYYSSPRSTDPFLESQLDLRDETGATMPGYGWVFPLGDGTVNVGVGLADDL